MANFTFDLDNFEYFLLILVRVSCFVYLAPAIGTQGVPNRVKVGLAFFVSLVLYTVVDRPELTYSSVVGYSVVVVKEAITGLLIGFAANICTSIVLFAGNMIDMDIGLSMATEFNQDMATETTLSGNMYYYLVMLLLISTNLYSYLMRAIADTFTVIPIGGQVFDMDSLLSSMMQYMGDLFQLGFRIFLPFFATIMILNCVLGIMAKVAPQLNMFSVGMQLKVLAGFIVMFLVMYLLPGVADLIFRELKTMVRLFAEGMY